MVLRWVLKRLRAMFHSGARAPLRMSNNEERMEVDDDSPPPLVSEPPQEPREVERPERVPTTRRSERVRSRQQRNNGLPRRVPRQPVEGDDEEIREFTEEEYAFYAGPQNPLMRRRIRTPPRLRQFIEQEREREQLLSLADMLADEVIGQAGDRMDEEDLPGGSNDTEPRIKRTREEIKEEDCLDIFEELQGESIRRLLYMCGPRDRLLLNQTCRAVDHLFKIEKTWRNIKVRGVLYKEGVIEVMVTPFKKVHRPLEDVTADRHHVIAPYICLSGDLDQATVEKIAAALKKNQAQIDKIVINPVSWGTGTSNFDLAPEIITKLAESCQATKLHICTNTTTNVELLTSRRQAKVLKHLILGTSLVINQWQLEKQQFHTFVAKHRDNLDPKCIIPLIKEWASGKRIIKFLQLGISEPAVDPTEALHLMGLDVDIPGDALWTLYYNKSTVNEFLPVKWSQPETAKQGWLFYNEKADDPDQTILLAFFLGQKITIGSVEGLKANVKLLPQEVLDVPRPSNFDTEDFHSDITERHHTVSRNNMLGMIRRHRYYWMGFREPMFPDEDGRPNVPPRERRPEFMEPLPNLHPHIREEEVEGEEQGESEGEEPMDSEDTSSTVSMASPRYTPDARSLAGSTVAEEEIWPFYGNSSDEDSTDDESPRYSPERRDPAPEPATPQEPEQNGQLAPDELEMIVHHELYINQVPRQPE